MAWGQAHIKGTREGCLGGVLLKMVAIVQDDVVYGRNLPGTILFSLLLVIDLVGCLWVTYGY